MSEIITKEDGTQIEVFTAEEIEAQKQEAIESYKLENPDKTDELNALQEELKSKQESLDKANSKDLNFANLRKAKEEAEKKVGDILKGVDEKISTIKKEVMEGVMKDHYSETLKALAGEDDEIRKKIEYHYKRLADTAATKEEVSGKLRDAYLLATKQDITGSMNQSAFSSSGAGKPRFKDSTNKFTPEEKALAQKLAQAGGLKLEEKDF